MILVTGASSNVGGEIPLRIRFRALQPFTLECLGPGLVLDEVMIVIIPPFSTLHQTFSAAMSVPGHISNSMEVPEPVEPWCVTVSAFFIGGTGFIVRRADVRMTFEFDSSGSRNDDEDEQ